MSRGWGIAVNRREFFKVSSLAALTAAFPEIAIAEVIEEAGKGSDCNLDDIAADFCAEKEYGDYSAEKYEPIARAFPQSAPYLEIIHNACREFSSIYHVSVELEAAKLMQESGFDPNAVSKVGAAGIAQLMPYTAKGLGLEVYVDDNFSEGFEMFRKGSKLERDAYEAFKRLDENCLNMRKEALVLTRNAMEMLESYKKGLLEHQDEDERIGKDEKTIKRNIRVGVKHLALQIKSVTDWFHSPIRPFNVLRGLAAYNAGFGLVRDFHGFPAIDQTVDYVRKIMRNLDSIYIYRKYT